MNLSDAQKPKVETRADHIDDFFKKMRMLLHTSEFYRNCMTCQHFIEHMETCTIANARPPARVIAYGCPSYSEDVPF